jgi:hypothetical protein
MPSNRPALPSYVQSQSGEWIVISQKGRTARFHNPRKETILLIEVDGKMITSGERVDYLVAHPKVVDIIVELKGSDVSKAIRQIRATRPVWLCHELAGLRCAALVVRGQGIHPKEQARAEKWRREFRKALKMRLLIETRNRNYEFEEFLLPEHERA